MATYYVGETSLILEGTHHIIELEGRSIGIYNIKGEFFAIHNFCPHQGAELCKGQVCGTTLPSRVYEFVYGRDKEIVRCPWHGWEFDIKTGKSLFSDRIRTRSYQVNVQDGQLRIIIGGDKE